MLCQCNPHMTEIPWEEIKKACCEGMTFAEAGRKFNVKDATIRKRALRKQWPTPHEVGKKAKAIAAQADATGKTALELAAVAVAATLAERGEKHREEVFEKASGALKKAKLKPPRNWKDADIADKMARRAAGLDNLESVSQTLIQINECAADEEVTPVVEAEVVQDI